MAPVVTISAFYGAGGSVVGPAVAERLELPFLDRAISTEVARSLAVPVNEADAHDERRQTGVHRLLSALAVTDPVFGPLPMPEGVSTGVVAEQKFLTRTEQVIRTTAETTGGVFLGRAAVLVLRDHPNALHVSLEGSKEARIHQVAQGRACTESEARKVVDDMDRGREAYFRHFYRTEIRAVGLYQLSIDATVIDFATCADLIVTAARAHLEL